MHRTRKKALASSTQGVAAAYSYIVSRNGLLPKSEVFFSITKQRQPSSLQSKDNLHLCLWPGTSHLSSGNSASGTSSRVYSVQAKAQVNHGKDNGTAPTTG